MSADGLRVREDLRPVRVLLGGDRADLFEQWQVDVRVDVTLHARIAVPVPGAAEVAAGLDDAEVLDTHLEQADRHEQPPEAAADDQSVRRLLDGRSLEAGLDEGIDVVVLPFGHHLAVLRRAVRPQPLVALDAVLLADRFEVDVLVEEALHIEPGGLHRVRSRRGCRGWIQRPGRRKERRNILWGLDSTTAGRRCAQRRTRGRGARVVIEFARGGA